MPAGKAKFSGRYLLATTPASGGNGEPYFIRISKHDGAVYLFRSLNGRWMATDALPPRLTPIRGHHVIMPESKIEDLNNGAFCSSRPAGLPSEAGLTWKLADGKNGWAEAPGITCTQVPYADRYNSEELLVNYCDGVLKGLEAGNKLSETEIRDRLESVVNRLRYGGRGGGGGCEYRQPFHVGLRVSSPNVANCGRFVVRQPSRCFPRNQQPTDSSRIKMCLPSSTGRPL